MPKHPVATYLCSCYLYYELNVNVLTDDEFNSLCRDLLDNFDSIEHMHKHLLSPEALKASTGYDIVYPEVVKHVAINWYNTTYPKDPICTN